MGQSARRAGNLIQLVGKLDKGDCVTGNDKGERHHENKHRK